VTDIKTTRSRGTLSELARCYTQLPATVHVLCLGSLLNRAGSFVMIFLSIYVADQLDLGKQFATRCVGMVGLGSVISSLMGGQLADQFGRRRTMLTALFGGAVVLVAMSQLSTAAAFLISALLFAVVMEMYRPACAAMIGDVSTVEQRPYAFGLMYIAINLGFAMAPPIGGFLAEVDVRWLFWGDAITTAGFGLIVLFFVSETRPRRLPGNHAAAESLPSPVMGLEDVPGTAFEVPEDAVSTSPGRFHIAHEVDDDADVPVWTAVRHIASDTTFLLYCFSNLLTCIVFMQSFSTLPLHLTDRGYSEFDYGAMISVNGIMIVVLQLPMTHLLNRFNRVAMILVGECFIAIGFGLTAFANSTVMFVTTIILWTCGEIIQAPFKQSIVADLAPANLRARYMGVFTMSYSLALMIGAPLGGEVLVRMGAQWLWFGCFFVVSTAILLYMLIYRRVSEACVTRTA
jgi:MFS family permease